MEKIRLYMDRLWISPYVFSSYIALKEKGLNFEVVEMALETKENRQGVYRKSTLTGRVPALQIGDFWLAESSAIAEFLEEKFPDKTPLLPKDIHDRAQARMLMAWLRSDLAALRAERSTATMFYEKSHAPLSDECKRDVERVIEVTQALLEGQPRETLFGEWCLADSELAFMLHRLILNDIEVPSPVRSFASVNWQRTFVKEFVNFKRPAYVDYYR